MSYDFVLSYLPIYKAAIRADWDTVTEIFEKDPYLMTKQITRLGETPLIIAVRTHGFVEELVKHIVAVGAEDKLFATCYAGNNPLHHAAMVGNTTAARVLVEQNPHMTLARNPGGHTPLKLAAWHLEKEALEYLLSVTPDCVPGEEGVSPYTGVDGGDLITLTLMAGFNVQVIPMKESGVFNILSTIFNMLIAKLGIAFHYAPTTTEMIYQSKINDCYSNLLVNMICKTVIETGNHDMTWEIFGSAIATALEHGIHELIEECILAYPGIIWYDVGGFNLFRAAIKHRIERVYNLVQQISGHKVFAATQFDDDEENENVLHVAAKLAPPRPFRAVTSAALQMQRDLQWFMEVRNYVEPSYDNALNKRGQTPLMLFSDAHKELLVEAQGWIKNTASSCTVVAALIITIAFVVVFTVPGGNKDDGNPLFVNKKTFMLFIVSDAVALFSSTTSVLMFLGILTSGLAEFNFLHLLPRRLSIGLLSLFISLAATLIAFSSVIALVLQDKVTWIAAPLVVATSIPVYLFFVLQFPLLAELFKRTYGRSIFHPQNARQLC